MTSLRKLSEGEGESQRSLTVSPGKWSFHRVDGRGWGPQYGVTGYLEILCWWIQAFWDRLGGVGGRDAWRAEKWAAGVFRRLLLVWTGWWRWLQGCSSAREAHKNCSPRMSVCSLSERTWDSAWRCGIVVERTHPVVIRRA